MTKSTITRDELNEVIATYGKHHIAHRMANVLLAAMDSEPDCKERKLFCSTDTTRMRKTISVSAGTEDAPLYRHAQQPVNSEPVGYLFHNEYGVVLYSISDDATEGFSLIGPIYSVPQPAPVVPGKWIPVSEQMPEDRTQVILWDAEIGEVTSGHYSHKTHTFYHCGDAIENEITHWMPTPAAPQEMKGE
ncbi:TPA: DUF551 domain-containing protein [Escherichia coli]|uniref:DUF551 domain-containing protein n=1 Tax=Escherichia coli TaxID=562 RepID=A0A2H4TYU6_ECOLX|nr:hypothetical protein CV83915_04468 [Escherichia coli]EEU9339237.1 DUF551 domain-containing protein [Escherichia coli]EEW1851071.1 DUF551 domain-containing protein [Escherichia coli]EEY9362674.1 DUF551 domain-containing protein [Escherichia coli]EFL4137231.1 DUF551 domain-containing protein [Escherichia coli]